MGDIYKQFFGDSSKYQTDSDEGIKKVTIGGKTYDQFDLDVVLRNKNPRFVFLLGQLYIEMVCDEIINIYFLNTYEGVRSQLLMKFLKSRDVDFFAKIQLLKDMKITEQEKEIKLIDVKIITSLYAIATIRNAYQHNIRYNEALTSLIGMNNSCKFSYLDKNITQYNDTIDLMNDFKKEIETVHNKLQKNILWKLCGSNFTY